MKFLIEVDIEPSVPNDGDYVEMLDRLEDKINSISDLSGVERLLVDRMWLGTGDDVAETALQVFT